eukprot:symbB.v1.2.017371.t1/scaffold1352.1/size234417/20
MKPQPRRGLGASDVFVALLSQNRELVRKVKPDTVTRFIRFIRVLGPLDTWLLFLKALCNPQNDGAISDKQQLVLSKIAFAGWYAPKADQAAVKQNRQELMINVALEGPLGVALTRSADRQVDPKECLGTALLVHGIHDVAISWAHPGTWQVGKVLYHGPEALKLPILKSTGDRKWISLAQVVWVLQPSELCETVTGQSWSKILADESGDSSDWQQAAVLGKPHKSRDAGNPFDGSRIDLLRSLARYFQAQLQLVASLAKERQMNSIMALQEEYTYSLCLSGAADPRLPSIIRASFFDLLMPRLMRSAQPGQAVLTLPVFRMQKDLALCSRSAVGRRCLRTSPRRSPVHILSACNEYRQETLILERSAVVHGYSFQPVGLGQPFSGVGMKLFLYDKALKEMVGRQIPPNEPVLLLDAWDTIILGPAEEFVEKLHSQNILSEGAILCGADRICAPEYKMAPKMERYFPDISTPWRYPNSGCIAGTAAAVTAFIHGLVHGTEGGSYGHKDDDQLRVQEFLLNWQERGVRYPFYLDHECCMFQNMGEPECGWDFELSPTPRLRNRSTQHQPLVAHGCGGHGRWFLSDVYRELGLIEFLELDPESLSALPYAGLVIRASALREEAEAADRTMEA